MTNWEIPKGYLCPPIPGRADYIHHISDLLASSNNGIIPKDKVRGLDVGVGANCIYPIIGSSIYDWNFVGSDIEIESINSVENIINSNETTPFSTCIITSGAQTCNSKPSLLIVSIKTDKCNSHLPETKKFSHSKSIFIRTFVSNSFSSLSLICLEVTIS